MNLLNAYLKAAHDFVLASILFTCLPPFKVLEQYFTTERHHRSPEPHRWTAPDIEALVEKAHQREGFSYGKIETDYLYRTFDQYTVRGQQGLVLGTETPWLEAILLANGVLWRLAQTLHKSDA